MTLRPRVPRALAGVRVVELAPTPWAALTGQLLGELGADVIRIESPAGDPLRADAGAFRATCRHKRSLTLDFAEPGDRETMLRLMRTADALLDGHEPGTLDRAGLGYERARRVAPRLVFCAVTPYGQRGPYSTRPAREPNLAAVAGLATSASGGIPTLPALPVATVVGALYASTSILAALRARDRTNEGQFIDVAVSDAAAALLGPVLLGATDSDASMPGCGIYRTRDRGHVSVAASTPRAWARLCVLLGRPELEAARATVELDPAARARVDADLAAIFLTRDQDEWLDLLADDEVGAAPVHDLTSAQRDPHFVDHGLFVSVSSGMERAAGQERWPAVRFPVKLEGTPAEPPLAPPTVGQHDEELLRELGLSAEEIRMHHARRPATQEPSR